MNLDKIVSTIREDDSHKAITLDRIEVAMHLFASARFFEQKDKMKYAPVVALLKQESDAILKLGLSEMWYAKTVEG